MAITEDQRHAMYEGLIEVLGREKATTLMEHLPPVGWADVATRRDLDQQTALLRHELHTGLADMRTELHAGLADGRAGLADMRTELHTGLADGRAGLADMRTELHTGLADGRADLAGLRDELHTGLADGRADLAVLRDELHAGLAASGARLEAMRAELYTALTEGRMAQKEDTGSIRAEIASVRVDLAGAEAGFERAMREQTRVYLLGMISANAALAGLAFTAARLFGG